ncbi:hypothetical protein CD790_10595 [Streptomyces sp. SAJ15]|nr:hypothetical protein CD790_10595 [Streptomyces sp. SAJ15]
MPGVFVSGESGDLAPGGPVPADPAPGGLVPGAPAPGTPAPGGPVPGTLVVANHISWLDVLALLAVEPVTMLAKREVAGWPVVGGLVRRAGTLFIDRDSLRGVPDAVAGLAERLRSGRSVMVFPQGATWCSGAGGRFRRATFQAALDVGAPIRPVTLSYVQHRMPTTVAAFVGEDDFASSLRRIAGAGGLAVRVRVHRPLPPARGVDDRRALAARAQAVIRGAVPEAGYGGEPEGPRGPGAGRGRPYRAEDSAYGGGETRPRTAARPPGRERPAPRATSDFRQHDRAPDRRLVPGTSAERNAHHDGLRDDGQPAG